ncbi:MAG: exodeoxyribonuclease VII large subunit [Chloroflexota bacterium]|nr:exodeoxyribonuclease VII large subunit [Chloroflexota bacterium]MDE2941021.1 exodeoxyribonuclease VII large subunit [Chloroflexota bacterium]MDE3268211.1 exodeoxyribonuclease VII large subunit [Chloroflexota bacterium]
MPVYSVGQVTRYLKESLDADAVLSDLWVRGEVSNLFNSAAGHYYFTLKDAAGQIRCVMFRPATGGENLSNGGAVITHGRVSLYEVRGDLQLYVDMVQPEGVGERHLELERLKARLEAEGLFHPSRKRPLPEYPRRIAVVTSPFGSVWHDIQNVIGRRYPLAELALAPAPVQGEGAAAAIAEALEAVDRETDVDVVIVARGGGSLEELWPFNEEVVARAIYASRAPVVSAVGHETDYTVADLVADARAPTPSAAAEMVAPDRSELLVRVRTQANELSQRMGDAMESHVRELDQSVWRLNRSAPDVTTWRQRLDDLSTASGRSLQTYLAVRGERVKGLEFRLETLSPANVLSRGYAVVQRQDSGETVTSVAQITAGDEVQIKVSDGEFAARTLAGGRG